MLTRPARDVEPAAVVEAIERGMKQTGYEEFSLLSLSCSDYLALPAVGIEVKNRLKDYNISLSLPSQRVDRFDENIANTIGGIRQGSLTFAPEAGTQRLRDIINKGLTNEELLRGIQTAVDSGWDKIKLYFMIGLPGETDEDVVGIVETVDWLQRECRRQGRKPLNFNITISNFTPKPHTPFQWHSVSTAEFQRKQELLRREFRNLRGVKVNYTDVRISAMEDFIGRGDRSLSPVIRRAWELGAGMDAWWESLDRAYHAWAEAIAAAGLAWKYRQVEAGEWNVFGTDIDNADATNNPFARPLPWDILDTGIDKQWLQEDLTRALAESTIPDCSFDGCSHCGVCGVDFGHNVVVPAPPIPTFTGHFTPNKTKAQRLRVTFGKTGDLSLVSHLDLLRVFDRAIRRSQIPIAYNGGFHPSPRIAIANALTLGATGDGEIVEFELTQTMDLAEFQTKLTAVLPPELPLHQVESVDLSLPYANQLISQSRYTVVLSTTCADENGNFNEVNWQKWIDTLLATPEIWQEKKTKSGKIAKIDLRSWLYSLELLSCRDNTAQIRYTGNCTADGSQLRPEGVAYCFREVTGETIDLLSIHREALIF
jgi:radical SAM-linked protein